MTDSPSTSIIRRYREPRTRWLPCHQKRAGLGVWAAVKSWQARNAIKRWKRTLPFDPELLSEFSGAVAGLIRAWSPVLPPGTVITAPPQGASVGQPYAAEALVRAVAEVLGLPYVELLVADRPQTPSRPARQPPASSVRLHLARSGPAARRDRG